MYCSGVDQFPGTGVPLNLVHFRIFLTRHQDACTRGKWTQRCLIYPLEDSVFLHIHHQDGQWHTGKWVPQQVQEIDLLEELGDVSVRDLYWCTVLKFQHDLLLDTLSSIVVISSSEGVAASRDAVCHVPPCHKYMSRVVTCHGTFFL